MIEQFPVNFECSILHVIGTKSHFIVIGQVEGTYVSQEYVKDGKLDPDKFSPLLWYPDKSEYVAVSRALGKPHSIGGELKH
jgi:flavin reductase (DIM6/NTAB) family NADH-FMN oxidoreductase RutF